MTTQPPTRIRRRRTRGWRAPLDANGLPPIYAGRPSPWANPWRVEGTTVRLDGITTPVWECGQTFEARRIAVRYFRLDYLPCRPDLVDRARRELAGRNLMCWCPEDEPCHVDVWLRVAASPDGAGLCERCWHWDADPARFPACPQCGRVWDRLLPAVVRTAG